MLQQSVVSIAQVPQPVDAFEQFAIDELGAEIVEVEVSPPDCAVDFCWVVGHDSESVVPPPSDVPFHSQPHNYLTHLLTIPQLPAPGAGHPGRHHRR